MAGKWPDFKRIPGTVSVRLVVFEEGDPRHVEVIEGRVIPNAGIKLAEVQKQLQGDRGKWREPFRGDEIEISIAMLRGYDPDKTYLQFVFSFEPDQNFLASHPDIARELQEYGETAPKSGAAPVRIGQPSLR